MIIRKIFGMLVLLMCFSSNSFAAESPPNVAFLQFVDRTPYQQLNTGNVVSELLLNELIGLDEINIVEHGIIKEALEEEKNLNNNSSRRAEAAEKGDFAMLLENQRQFNIGSTKVGDLIPLNSVKRIGDKYGADYLLHGTIFKLGTEEETEVVPVFWGIQKTKLYLTATAIVRLVEVETGQVVWIYQGTGKAVDRKYDAAIVSAGAEGFNATMYDKALAECAQVIAKELDKNIKGKRLVLKKGRT